MVQRVLRLGYSFEAKFKLKDRFQSVEFDSLGNVLDVKIEMEGLV